MKPVVDRIGIPVFVVAKLEKLMNKIRPHFWGPPLSLVGYRTGKWASKRGGRRCIRRIRE
jgi:hypothetical protein